MEGGALGAWHLRGRPIACVHRYQKRHRALAAPKTGKRSAAKFGRLDGFYHNDESSAVRLTGPWSRVASAPLFRSDTKEFDRTVGICLGMISNPDFRKTTFLELRDKGFVQVIFHI